MKMTQRHRKNGRLDQKVLAEIVRSVVEAAQPDKIILFGSAARGEMGPNSDLDLLVIKSGKFSHDRVTREIYRHLSAAVAIDALVVTPEVLEQYGDSPYLVYYPALREGTVIYQARKNEGPVPPPVGLRERTPRASRRRASTKSPAARS
jgi:predicted nucleotidyltransferase